jgi:NADH-quinone oxidoreductase subunit C
MWGSGSGDVSGFGGISRPVVRHRRDVRPYGGWFDEVADQLLALVPGLPDEFDTRLGELTAYVPRECLLAVVRAARDDARLRFEVCTSVNGVHYPDEAGEELHVVYHLLSMTHNRRLRLEVAVSEDDPVIESVTSVYPHANWHERETWDMFGIEFAHHPGLTRILMPDDWEGHPQRKDYPLGGIPVEFKGAETPPPDERRSY